jgi:YhcH/YjgK/YiaL family protein
MILDTLAQAQRYIALHPGFAPAFEFLKKTDLKSLEPGRHAIDGDRLWILVDHKDGRGREGARLEAHRGHIDIQFTFEGSEEIGWRPTPECQQPAGEFDGTKDIVFFDDRPTTWLSVKPGRFAIFFPDDAHAPLAGHGMVKKVIVKVRKE